MTEEQKKALIERCEKISEWREKYGDYANVMLPAVEAQQIAQIALTALTAPAADLAELVPDEMTWNQAHSLLDINQCGEDRFSAFMMGANYNRSKLLCNIEEGK